MLEHSYTEISVVLRNSHTCLHIRLTGIGGCFFVGTAKHKSRKLTNNGATVLGKAAHTAERREVEVWAVTCQPLNSPAFAPARQDLCWTADSSTMCARDSPLSRRVVDTVTTSDGPGGCVHMRRTWDAADRLSEWLQPYLLYGCTQKIGSKNSISEAIRLLTTCCKNAVKCGQGNLARKR
jgi:hypothetical protein